jgi:hypothetical protein
MREQIKSWTDELDNVTQLFNEDFSDLNEEQLNLKPSQDIWSIAQTIEHIIIINQSYFPAISKIKSGDYKQPVTSRINFLVKQFGNIIFKSVRRDNPKKLKTMPLWNPSSSNISGDILEKFLNHQEELKSVIVSCEYLLNQGTIISSPANRFIAYKLERAFDIIVEHEFRHLVQAERIKALLNL